MIAFRGMLLAALLLGSSLTSASETDVTVVYWSAKDCTWCLHWETSGKPQLEPADESRQVKFHTVKSERLADRYSKEMFAPEISWVWERYSENGYKAPGRPSWDVYIGNERVAAFYGTKVWDSLAIHQERR